MSNREEKLHTSVYLPEDQVKLLKQLSRATDRNHSWLVSKALEIAWPTLQRFIPPGQER